MSVPVKKGKLTLIALILMVFTSVFGFTNIPRSFYLMGYSAIPWYVLSAFAFFLPFAFMMAEFGAAFKDRKGGIYAWMSESVSPKFAFIGTFMWYASYLIWMVNVGSGIWIVLSNAITGRDTTQEWSLFGLNSVATLGVLAIGWISFLTFISMKGLDKIKRFTSIGGIAVSLLNIVLLLGGLLIIALNGGQFMQPVDAAALTHSPNPKYASFISILSFLVFAIFAYGGIEVVGGLVDETENPEQTFPKGVAISAAVIAVGYSLGIFLMGAFTPWEQLFAGSKVTLGNVSYLMFNNMGVQLGHALGTSPETATQIGNWFARYMGASMFLALTGAFFTLMFAPLKQLIEGTPRELWPARLGDVQDGQPKRALFAQALLVILLIGTVAFGGQGAAKFFEILVAMTNVSMTIPYMFLALAFIGFKNKDHIAKPYVVFRNKTVATVIALIVTATVGFANIFTVIEPVIKDPQGGLQQTIYSIMGPVTFGLIALLMYNAYEKKVTGQVRRTPAQPADD